MQLTKSEMEIMDLLWQSDRPMGCHDILKMPHTWKDSSVHIMLNGLLKKGAIVLVGLVKCRKTYGRTFAPAMSREQYWAQLAYCGKPQNKPVTPVLIAEILREAQICPDAVPAILAAARDEYERRHGF